MGSLLHGFARYGEASSRLSSEQGRHPRPSQLLRRGSARRRAMDNCYWRNRIASPVTRAKGRASSDPAFAAAFGRQTHGRQQTLSRFGPPSAGTDAANPQQCRRQAHRFGARRGHRAPWRTTPAVSERPHAAFPNRRRRFTRTCPPPHRHGPHAAAFPRLYPRWDKKWRGGNRASPTRSLHDCRRSARLQRRVRLHQLPRGRPGPAGQ